MFKKGKAYRRCCSHPHPHSITRYMRLELSRRKKPKLNEDVNCRRLLFLVTILVLIIGNMETDRYDA
ncbi:hypothetical protein E2C01_041742 [Portunus trituberculatus]|uniref:Transmembrane protein n=1 Tax=Portunus trituberculatus TaxID=210409 RepID=A0A5B7FKP0_PORTR|nr:hypothetical protein [Portunus trituberculatus]